MTTPEPGIHIYKIYYAAADSNDEPRPIGTMRADSQALALEKAAQLRRIPDHDLLAEQDTLTLGHALAPDLQLIYEQAETDLAQYGREEARYYCRRRNLYVTEEEVNRVAALERVLDTLEQATSKEHALALLDANIPTFIDPGTHDHYIELIREEHNTF